MSMACSKSMARAERRPGRCRSPPRGSPCAAVGSVVWVMAVPAGSAFGLPTVSPRRRRDIRHDADPGRISSVVAATPAATLRGRVRELDVLSGALDTLATGRPAVVLVEGEAGIGKTRLLADTLADARSRGFSVATGQGEELERTRPSARSPRHWTAARPRRTRAAGRSPPCSPPAAM